jgi:hypothetical protein
VRTAPTLLAIGAVALWTLPLAGCGSDRAAMTAPSSLQTAVASTTASIEILPRGAVNTTTPITVTSLVPGTSCPTLQFTISSYKFNVDAATQYTGGTCANIQPGALINFNGNRLTETGSVFYVTQLSFGTTTTPPPPAPAPTPTTTPVQGESTITAIGAGVCPELQFFFGSYALNVSYATQYSGGACSDLKPGARLAIVGTKKDSESFVRVTSVVFKHDTTPPTSTSPTQPDPNARPVEGDGTIGSLSPSTACPTLQFYIGPYLIKVDGSTQYVGGGCADLNPGVQVTVKGTMASDNSVSATAITIKSAVARPTEVEGQGVVTAVPFGTACPSLQFNIGEYTITVNASTQFVGGSCPRIGVGKTLLIKGTMVGDKTVTASQVTFRD